MDNVRVNVCLSSAIYCISETWNILQERAVAVKARHALRVSNIGWFCQDAFRIELGEGLFEVRLRRVLLSSSFILIPINRHQHKVDQDELIRRTSPP